MENVTGTETSKHAYLPGKRAYMTGARRGAITAGFGYTIFKEVRSLQKRYSRGVRAQIYKIKSDVLMKNVRYLEGCRISKQYYDKFTF